MQTQIESGSVSLAIDVYRLLKQDQQNLVVSPFLVTTAMSMSLMGCRGQTAKEISKALFGAVIQPDKFKQLAEELNTIVGEAIKVNDKVLSVANFMYIHRKFKILADFKQTLENNFQAQAVEVDFTKSQETINTINQDISRATREKIPQIIQQVSAATRLIIANAVYFKGAWYSKFHRENTKKQAFTLSNGEVVEVDMMQQNEKLNYFYSDQLKCKALKMLFRESNTSLIFLLPDKSSSLKSLESSLTPPLIDQLIDSIATFRVDVWLPKFNLKSTLALIPVLKQLGINELFDSDMADMSGIAKNERLFVSDVFQQALIDVNEEGAEAAAAVGMLLRPSCYQEYQRVEFKADRPFLFLLISQCHTVNRKTILFMGAVEDPRN